MKRTYAIPLVVGCAVTIAPIGCIDSPRELPPPTDVPPSESPPDGDGESDIGITARSLIADRVDANRSAFYIFQNADSGFNHGFPTGFFADSAATLAKISIEPACLDDSDSADRCSIDPDRLDRDRGTVLRISFEPLLPGEYVGLHIEEPEHWGAAPRGSGYDLTGATGLVFDVRSPSPGGVYVQFGIGGRVWSYMHIAQGTTYTTMRLPFNSMRHPGMGSISAPELGNTHVLFSIATNDIHAPLGGTVLVDNVRVEPLPNSQRHQVSFPLASEVYGVVHRQVPDSGRVAFPLDQVLANATTTYESALSVFALLSSSEQHQTAARVIADAFVYALENDNEGLPLPIAADGTTGLRNAYSSGDLTLFNSQDSDAGQEGQVRLAGFTASPELCGGNGYCLVLDGATGGNNAFAMLALLAAYEHFHDARYLDGARTIGRWMIGILKDGSGTGYGGYFLGYPDEGISPKTLIRSKSTENNADIFAALTRMAGIERSLGNNAEADEWAADAAVAADFVLQMHDPARGCFHAGTVPAGDPPAPGIDPTGPRRGDDVINVYDFLDSNTFSTLALASAYAQAIDWRRPVQHVLDTFALTVAAGEREFHGFSVTSPLTAGPNGMSWEFTGQVVAAMRLVDTLYGEARFEGQVAFYLDQIRRAQASAPFADGRGLVASTLEDGELLPPIEQCLSTPFQCIPQRVGLAATAWAVFAEEGTNPLASVPSSNN